MEKSVKFFLFLIGAYALYTSFKYGIWVDNGPGGGFIALFIGLILMILCGYSFLKEKSEVFKVNELKKALIPFLGILFTLLIIKIFGFLIAIAIYILLWLTLIEKYRWFKATMIDLTICAFMYAVFSLWLRVPFPNGILF